MFCLDGQAESRTQYTAFIPVHLTKSLWLFEDYWCEYLYIFFKLRRPSSINQIINQVLIDCENLGCLLLFHLIMSYGYNIGQNVLRILH